MISKELLVAVLNIKNKITHIDMSVNNRYVYCYFLTDKDYLAKERKVDTYELMHKCKEWALNKGYQINSWINGCSIFFSDTHEPYLVNYEAESEPEAVYKACEFILNNKG